MKANLRRGFVVIIILSLTGCAATSEVKQASSEVGAALGELQASGKAFQTSYLLELGEIQRLVISSILADAVNREIELMVDEEFDGDLIQLSDSIKNERYAAQSRVKLVLNKLPPEDRDSDHEDFVLAALRSAAPPLRSRAKIYEERNPKLARILRDEADLLENDPSAGVHEEELEALMTLVELEGTRISIKEGLKDLGDYVTLLEMIHNQVNEWVVTDVKVKGEDLAILFDNIASLNPTGGEP
jgi:hypothetical protein